MMDFMVHWYIMLTLRYRIYHSGPTPEMGDPFKCDSMVLNPTLVNVEFNTVWDTRAFGKHKNVLTTKATKAYITYGYIWFMHKNTFEQQGHTCFVDVFEIYLNILMLPAYKGLVLLKSDYCGEVAGKNLFFRSSESFGRLARIWSKTYLCHQV